MNKINFDNPLKKTIKINYSQQWSTATPGYIIFLVDQSRSMGRKFSQDETRAEFTAKVINRTINELIVTNTVGMNVKNRIFISIIGYGGKGGNSIENLRSDYLDKLEQSQLRLQEVRTLDGAVYSLPIFLEPRASGNSPIADALKYAEELVKGWISKKINCPAPVIINITDGSPYVGKGRNSNKEKEINRTIEIAKKIMNLETEDGPPLIFNAHIDEDTGEIKFPLSKSEIKENQMAQLLFDISSHVPLVYQKSAQKYDLSVRPNTKGFIANATTDSLIKFINFGSSGGFGFKG